VRVNSLRIGSDEEEQPYVSLGHDALAKVAARWQEEQTRWKQVRKFTMVCTAAVLVCLAISASLLAFQFQKAKADKIQFDNDLKELKRQADARERQDALFYEAQAAAATKDWKSVYNKLDQALNITHSNPTAPLDDWLHQREAATLFDRAKLALAERTKFDALAEFHSQAVFYSALAVGLGLNDTQRLHEAVDKGLAEFDIKLEGTGPPQFVSLEPSESTSVTQRCYDLLLLKAESLAKPVAGENAEVRTQRLERVRLRLERAERLLPGIKTKSGLTQKAQYLKDVNKEQDAATALDEAKKTKPDLATDHFLVGLNLFRRREYSNAIPSLAAALQAEPTHYGAQYVLAVCYLQAKQPHEAKIGLTRCLKQRPDFNWPRLQRAQAEMALANKHTVVSNQAEAYQNALDDLNAILDKPPDDAARYIALIERAVVRIHLKEWEKAAVDLKAAIQLHPHPYQAYINLQSMLRERAVAQTRRAVILGLVPHGHVAVTASGAVLLRTALDEAVALLDKAIPLQPGVALLYHERGHLHRLRGNAQLAKDDLDNAVRLAEQNNNDNATLAEDLLELGRLEHAAGQYKKAIETYKKILASTMKDPSEGPSVRQLALAARRLADPHIALETWSEAAKAIDLYLFLTPVVKGQVLSEAEASELAGTLKARGLIHAAQKNRREALDSYGRSLSFIRDPDVLVLRGWTYQLEGATGLGAKDFEEALKLRANDPDALLGWADTRVQLGQLREALAKAEEAILHIPNESRAKTRVRLLYIAARVFAQVAVRDPATWTRCVPRVADLLHQALPDFQKEGEAAKFWKDMVLTDPALNKISQSPALANVAAKFVARGP
jgi:tetratricopeptide (TPR) repeat protein